MRAASTLTATLDQAIPAANILSLLLFLVFKALVEAPFFTCWLPS